MTDILSDERLAEIRAGLEGVTPGGWLFDGNCAGYIDQGGYHIARAYAVADAAHIARCDKPTIAALIARLDKAEEGWQDISTAPTLERLFVAGWQRRSGTVAGYWWFEEDVTDENGVPMDKPEARLWRPLPPAPNLPEPIDARRNSARPAPNSKALPNG